MQPAGLVAGVIITFATGPLCPSATLSLSMVSVRLEGLVIPVVCVAAWIGLQHLGYVEFGVAGRTFLKGAFRRQLSAQISLQNYQRRLDSAATPQDCWAIAEEGSRDFGFHRARMVLAGDIFECRCDDAPAVLWQVNIPLSDTEFIELAGPFGDTSHNRIFAALADKLYKTLSPKLPAFAPRYLSRAARAGGAVGFE